MTMNTATPIATTMTPTPDNTPRPVGDTISASDRPASEAAGGARFSDALDAHIRRHQMAAQPAENTAEENPAQPSLPGPTVIAWEDIATWLAEGRITLDDLRGILEGGTAATAGPDAMADPRERLDADVAALPAAVTFPVAGADGKTLPSAASEVAGRQALQQALQLPIGFMDSGISGTAAATLTEAGANGEDGQPPDLRDLLLLMKGTGVPGSQEGIASREALPRQIPAEAPVPHQISQTLVAADAGRGIQPSAPPAMPSITLPLDVPVMRPGWDQALAGRVSWMLNNDTQSAELTLNPPHLGPVKVSIGMEGERVASVNFIANHGATREAIEAAIPRLREILAENGVNLGQVNVSSQGPGDPRGGWFASAADGGDAPSDPPSFADEVISAPVAGEGLIDFYA